MTLTIDSYWVGAVPSEWSSKCGFTSGSEVSYQDTRVAYLNKLQWLQDQAMASLPLIALQEKCDV